MQKLLVLVYLDYRLPLCFAVPFIQGSSQRWHYNSESVLEKLGWTLSSVWLEKVEEHLALGQEDFRDRHAFTVFFHELSRQM